MSSMRSMRSPLPNQVVRKVKLRAAPNDSVRELNAGKTRQQVLSGEVQTGVASVQDIDRSAELLIWLWESLWRKKETDEQQEEEEAEFQTTQSLEVALFGGGCFWCTEAVFARVRGVKATRCGFAGLTISDPSYTEVAGSSAGSAAGALGPAEVVEVTYDSSVVSFGDLMKVFLLSHDPTSSVGQGDDTGPQYRSLLVCTNEQQAGEAAVALTRARTDDGAPVTELLMARGGYGALAAEEPLVAVGAGGDGDSGGYDGGSAWGGDSAWGSDAGGAHEGAGAQSTSAGAGGAGGRGGGAAFFPAEAHHQRYYELNANVSSYCSLVVAPKLAQLASDPRVGHLFVDAQD